jgi:hypothetical protein
MRIRKTEPGDMVQLMPDDVWWQVKSVQDLQGLNILKLYHEPTQRIIERLESDVWEVKKA